jgi:hypothetical protein
VICVAGSLFLIGEVLPVLCGIRATSC